MASSFFSEGDFSVVSLMLIMDSQESDDLLINKINQGVNKIFCGHAHFNCGGYYKNMEIVVTTAVGIQLGQDKHGIRLVQVQGEFLQ